MTGASEDDPERFFRRSVWDVGAGDLRRFEAACSALRKLDTRK